VAHRGLFWQILLPFLALLSIALAALAWEASRFLRDFYLEETASMLEQDARLLEPQLRGLFGHVRVADVDALCKDVGRLLGKRVTAILSSGEVIGDSSEDAANMDNHASRPEVKDALAGRAGRSIRYSHTLHSDWIYVAVPLFEPGTIAGVVRVSTSLASVNEALRRVYLRTMAASGAVALLAAIISFILTRRIARPIRRMKEGAARFAQGDFSERLAVPDSSELADLALAMNRMADDLNERITRLRRLERTRSDFVANLSHEIRTPVTSIKGYAETLLGGALTDPDALKPFLEIIARQADRLSTLVDDILSLADLERAENAGDRPFDMVHLRGLIETAMYVCAPKASSKQVAFILACPGDLRVRGNAPLLEQAVVNLLDNATKYSEAGRDVRIEAVEQASEIVISVLDFGCGIAKEHLAHIFERFYRADQARSRKLGGTGLGLAIVKHIATLHGGHVTVESTLEEGSRFTIHLPRPQEF